MKKFNILTALAALTFVVGTISAQPARSNAVSTDLRNEIILPDAHSFLLHDEKTQVNYRIYVALPQGYTPGAKRYPTLYMLDADGTFALATQAYRLLRVDPATPDLVLVGIGYEVTGKARRAQRERDLTPTRPKPGSDAGEAAAFLAFLAKTIVPTIESRYGTDPADRAIFGHSLGGLFALYALFEQPDLFRRYIISSPSLWWDDGVVLGYEKRFSIKRKLLPKSLFMSVGSMEPADMLLYFQPLADAFRSRTYERLNFSSSVLQDETHLTALPAAFLKGIRTVYKER